MIDISGRGVAWDNPATPTNRPTKDYENKIKCLGLDTTGRQTLAELSRRSKGWGLVGRGFGCLKVPIENRDPVPVQNTLESARVLVDLLKVLHPVRLAADVGVDGQRHDFRPPPTLRIEPV